VVSTSVKVVFTLAEGVVADAGHFGMSTPRFQVCSDCLHTKNACCVLGSVAISEVLLNYSDLICSKQLLDDVKRDIDSYEEAWSLYGQYSTELMSMAKEDWVSFRTR